MVDAKLLGAGVRKWLLLPVLAAVCGAGLLLVWRWGRFGKSRPFWKTGPDWGWSQHIDIYDWTGKNFRPAWMASDIGLDAAAWQFDEQQRLVITERNGRESAWDWISWGLVRIA